MINNDSSTTSNNDNNIDNFDNFLRAQLQQTNPYLNDENFTAQVIASLPAPKKIVGWQERVIIFVPLIIISLLVLSQNSLLAFIIKGWVLLSVISVENLFKLTLAISMAVLLSVSYWLAKKSRFI